jgi:hypothetical protein
MKSANGLTVSSTDDIINRWKEHYETLLNIHSNVDLDNISALIPQYNVNNDLDIPPSLEETKNAIREMKSNKATGVDSIASEAFKYGGDILISKFHELIILIWETQSIPQDFKDSIITNIYKGKGDRSECGNYRGISLLCVGGKILGKIMCNRFKTFMENFLPESQAGFRPKRGTTDMLFTLRQIQEKCVEQQQELHLIFIDIVKAYDCINRNVLWLILGKFGCPPRFLALLKELHIDNRNMVKVGQLLSETFQTRNGVRQGCVLAPVLFNAFMTGFLIIVDSMLRNRGVGINYRFDGGLHNLKRLKAKTRISQKYISELQYADDCVILSHSAEELQDMINTFAHVYTLMGLKINIEKTKYLHQNNDANVYNPVILIDNEIVEESNKFKYLGSYISCNGKLDLEIQYRIQSACASMAKLNTKVFKNRHISKKVKCQVYKSVTLPILLYGSETWVLYRKHLKQFEKFHQRSLRNIMNIKWFDFESNDLVLTRTNTKPVEALITKNQLSWTGHTIRMDDRRLPKQVLYGELAVGNRRKGAPKKRYKDTVNIIIRNLNIDENWETIAKDRSRWRRIIKEGSLTQINLRMVESGNRDISLCHMCAKICNSRIGLLSHLRAHERAV